MVEATLASHGGCVGWAKRSVPTIDRQALGILVGTLRFAHPTDFASLAMTTFRNSFRRILERKFCVPLAGSFSQIEWEQACSMSEVPPRAIGFCFAAGFRHVPLTEVRLSVRQD
jgi:hypothetical protein